MKALGWILLIATGFALYFSWAATGVMAIIDFIFFICVVRTSPITKESIALTNEPMRSNDNSIFTDYSHRYIPGNIWHQD